MTGISIVKSTSEVGQMLEQVFGVSKEELLQIVFAAAAARADTVPNDPRNAGGQFAYSYGVRATRDLFLAKGWSIDRTDNIEATKNSETGIKVVFQNVDTAADPLFEPKAISKKGPAAKRLVAQGQTHLFADMEQEAQAQINATTWFLCVSDDGDEVRAEISCPITLEDGQFCGFHTRIFLLGSGEWENLAFNSDEYELPDDNIEIELSRK